MGRRQARDWDKTIEDVYRRVPSARDIDWDGLFVADPKMLGGLVNDIIKVSVSEKGRPGKRSASNIGDVERDLAYLRQEDYTDLPFTEALQLHMRTRSVRQMAHLSGLNKDVIQRLIAGKGGPPTPEHMEAIAKALKKDPGYFIEYRAVYVASAIHQILLEHPEAGATNYSKMRKTANGNTSRSRKAK